MTPVRRALAAMILCFLVMPGVARAEDEWIVRESSRPVAETVQRLTTAIEKSGGRVSAVIDHSSAAESAGLELAPTTLVIFGNPRLGTPAMLESRRIAMDLPLKILVWEEEGVTRLGYLSTATLARRYDLPLDDKNLRRMDEALTSLAAAALARGEALEGR